MTLPNGPPDHSVLRLSGSFVSPLEIFPTRQFVVLTPLRQSVKQTRAPLTASGEAAVQGQIAFVILVKKKKKKPVNS